MTDSFEVVEELTFPDFDGDHVVQIVRKKHQRSIKYFARIKGEVNEDGRALFLTKEGRTPKFLTFRPGVYGGQNDLLNSNRLSDFREDVKQRFLNWDDRCKGEDFSWFA